MRAVSALGPSAVADRVAQAWRTLRTGAALRTHARLSGRRLSLAPPSGRLPGHVDRIEVRGGITRVAGWTAARTVTLRTERQTLTVAPTEMRDDLLRDGSKGPASRRLGRGFEARLAGTAFLEASVDGATVLRVTTCGPGRAALGWLRLGRAVSTICLRHAPALARFVLRGDEAAGDALEAVLLPPPDDRPDTPRAAAGLFAEADAAPLPEPDPVDIVVPVFDAHDDVAACLDHLERHTDPRHRIHLIDDASPDPRIPPLLAAFAARRATAAVHRLPENAGFVGAANHGLARARGHAILLNTDAFVPAGWLPRLVAPLADPDVASVTPLTSDGEIANVPAYGQRSDPAPETVGAYVEAAAALDPRRAVAEVPTGVGFCMAMGRRWLDRMPGFDPIFGKGYGEEVDWCRATARMGAKHLLTAAVFVHHRGGGSFGPEKAQRVADNNRLISRRYPGYDSLVASFKRIDPMVGGRLALAMAGAAAANDGGPVPVFLGHRLGGGAEHWLQARLRGHQRRGRGIAVVRDGDAPGFARLEVQTPDGAVTGDVPVEDLARYLRVAPRITLIYANLVGARAPLPLLEIAAGMLRPRDRLRVLFHDFFPLCPSYNLLSAEGAFCDLPGPEACESCHARMISAGAGEGGRRAPIANWRARWHAVIARAEAVIVFSPSSRDLVTRIWPDLAERIVLRPHGKEDGMDVEPAPVGDGDAAGRDGPPVVGVLGAIGYAKGAAVLRDLARAAEGRLRIVVIGTVAPGYAPPGLAVHGTYRRDEIGDLARRYGIQRWLIPSIWPETFSYTTHEALGTGLPVHAFDIGAQADALRDHPQGRLHPADLPTEDLAQALGAGPATEGSRGMRQRLRARARRITARANGRKGEVVPPPRLERGTSGSTIQRSNQLS